MNARSSSRRVAPRRIRRGRPRVGSGADREGARTTLLEAAEDVAAQHGIDAATIAAIAKRAGVAVGTLYNYFPDRDSIFGSLFEMRRQELVPRIEAAAREASRLPFERRLRAYLAAVLGVFEERRKFLQVALDQQAPKFRAKKTPLMTAMAQALADIVRAVDHETAEERAQMIQAAMKGLIHWRIEQGGSFVDDADLLADTFLEGIRAR